MTDTANIGGAEPAAPVAAPIELQTTATLPSAPVPPSWDEKNDSDLPPLTDAAALASQPAPDFLNQPLNAPQSHDQAALAQPTAQAPQAPAALTEVQQYQQAMQQMQAQHSAQQQQMAEMRGYLQAVEQGRMQQQQAPAQLAAPPPMPDPVMQPQEFANWQEARFTEKLAAVEQRAIAQSEGVKSSTSFHSAAQQYGAATASAATKAAADAGLRDQFMRMPDPVGAAVQWHQQQQFLAAVGSDPNAWVDQQFQARLADPKFVEQYIAPRLRQAAPPAHIPQSLAQHARANTAVNAGVQSSSDWFNSTLVAR